jgi:hypothetical protein
MQFFHIILTSLHLGSNIHYTSLFSNILDLYPFLRVRDHVSPPYKSDKLGLEFVHFNFKFFNIRLEDEKL